MKPLAVFALLAASQTQAACRQALALGLDVSGSVDETEYRLQLDGLALALTSGSVQEVLLTPGAAPVRIAVYEWSGPSDQHLILPWTTLSDLPDLMAAADRLRRHQRRPASPTTAIGPAMMAGATLLAQQPDCWKHTLDISGDGEANTGPLPQHVQLRPAPAGTIVNGLVIAKESNRGGDIRQLSSYFNAYVIRGPGAFVETALGFEDYAAAMERKLLRELSSLAIGQTDQ